MKVAFVADTHFGYPRFEEDASAQGRAAIIDAANRADALVLGGDIFDTRLPRLETLAEVAGLLADAGEILRRKAHGSAELGEDGTGNKIREKIDAPNLILGIHGTHERRGKDSLNPLQMMHRLGLMEDLHNRTVVAHMGEERCAFSGMGGIPDDLVPEALGRLSCRPIEGACNFFVFHQTMAEFVPQAQGLASLEHLPPGYDWYLCGHIHKRSEYMGGRLLIPGSTVVTQLRAEESGQKGYFLVDTESGKVEWIPIPCRQMEVAEVEFDGEKASEAREKLLLKVREIAGKLQGKRPILKVNLAGRLAPGAQMDLQGIAQEGVELFFDDCIDGGDVADAIGRLKEQWVQKATPAKLGRERLAENARKVGISAARADELFQMFCE